MDKAISSPCPPRVYVLVDQILVRAVFFTIAIGGWINKMWSIHAMEYYLTLETRAVLVHVAAWIYLEDIMQHELSQTRKTNTA